MALQRQVPAVFSSSSSLWFRSSTFCWTFLLCYRDRYLVLWYRKQWLFRSCSSSLAVDIPFVPQMLIPMVQSAQQIMENLQLLLKLVVDVPVAGSCRFSGAAVEKPLALPQLQLVEKSVTFYVPSCSAVTCSVFAFEVQVSGLFWEMTSGFFPYSALFGSTLDTCTASVYGAFEAAHIFSGCCLQVGLRIQR